MNDGSRAVTVWALTGALGVVGAVALASGLAGEAPQPIVCATRRVLDLPCAGCGMTRALAALFRGRIAEAVALHPLAPAVALQAVAAWSVVGLVVTGRRSAPGGRWVLGWIAVNLAAFVTVWGVRLLAGTLPR